eukprot:6172283-Pleurochrysis_carterae.AAC.1
MQCRWCERVTSNQAAGSAPSLMPCTIRTEESVALRMIRKEVSSMDCKMTRPGEFAAVAYTPRFRSYADLLAANVGALRDGNLLLSPPPSPDLAGVARRLRKSGPLSLLVHSYLDRCDVDLDSDLACIVSAH